MTPPVQTPAPFWQRGPVAASDGTDFLVLWDDPRSSRPDSFPMSQTHGTRVSASGTILDAPSLRFPGVWAAYAKVVVIDGRYLLVTFAGNGEIVSVVVGRDGVAQGSPRVVATNAAGDFHLATNGTTALLVWKNPSTLAVSAALLDASGALLQRIEPDVPRAATVFAATTLAGKYHILHVGRADNCSPESCEGVVRDVVFDGSRFAGHRELARMPLYSPRFVAKAGRSNVLVAWQDAGPLRVVRYLLFDETSAGAIQTVHSAEHRGIITTSALVAGWDGSSYLIAFGDAVAPFVDRLLAARVDESGVMRGGLMFLADGPVYDIDIARSSSHSLVTWSESPARNAPADVFAKVARDFGELASVVDPLLLSRAAALQWPPHVSDGPRPFAVWKEHDRATSIVATVVGTDDPIVVAERSEIARGNPAAAFSAGAHTVLWREETTDEVRIVRRRVSTTGELLDPAPVVLSRESRGSPYVDDSTVGVAVGSGVVLVTWIGADSNVRAMRLGVDGSMLDAIPIVVSRADATFGVIRRFPRAAWDGQRFAIVWTLSPLQGFGAPPVSVEVAIFGARIDSAGTLLDSTSRLLARKGFDASDLAAAGQVGDRLAIMWLAREREAPTQCAYMLVVSATTMDGAETPSCLPGSEHAVDVDLTTYRDGYFAALAQPAGIRGWLFDADGELVRNAIDISPSGYAPSVAALGGSIIAAYSRMTAGEADYDGSPRNFWREVFPLPRRRSATH